MAKRKKIRGKERGVDLKGTSKEPFYGSYVLRSTVVNLVQNHDISVGDLAQDSPIFSDSWFVSAIPSSGLCRKLQHTIESHSTPFYQRDSGSNLTEAQSI